MKKLMEFLYISLSFQLFRFSSRVNRYKSEEDQFSPLESWSPRYDCGLEEHALIRLKGMTFFDVALSSPWLLSIQFRIHFPPTLLPRTGSSFLAWMILRNILPWKRFSPWSYRTFTLSMFMSCWIWVTLFSKRSVKQKSLNCRWVHW